MTDLLPPYNDFLSPPVVALRVLGALEAIYEIPQPVVVAIGLLPSDRYALLTSGGEVQ